MFFVEKILKIYMSVPGTSAHLLNPRTFRDWHRSDGLLPSSFLTIVIVATRRENESGLFMKLNTKISRY